MAFLKDMNYETRIRNIRTSGRVNSRVAVAVEWNDLGKDLRAEGYTVDISPKGCLTVVPHGFDVGQRLRLVNLMNQISCEAVLVWRGHEGRTGWGTGLGTARSKFKFLGTRFLVLSVRDVSGIARNSEADFHRLRRRFVHFFLANQYLTNVKLPRPWGFSEGGTHI